MVENYFEENSKVLSLRGILGRRDFLVNTLIIQLVEGIIWATPVFYLLIFNPDMIRNFLVYAPSQSPTSIWVSIWLSVVGLVVSGLYFPSIVRRVRDILGVQDDNKIYFISSVLTVLTFMSYTPVGQFFLARVISLFIIISLIFRKGEITSKKPKNELLKFNWGAFLGTWVWGLFNKAPKTLLMIPLMFTLSGIPFMLICGLRGNQWAAKNPKFNSVEQLHKSQKFQAMVWSFAFPIYLFIGVIVVFFSMAFVLKLANVQVDDLLYKSQKNSIVYVESQFDKIELGKDVNKFYIKPELWSKLSNSAKKNYHKNASFYAFSKSIENNNNKDIVNEYRLKIFDIQNKTKVYSSFNNEVLIEFNLDEKAYSEALKSGKTSKDLQKLMDEAYKINNYPTIP